MGQGTTLWVRLDPQIGQFFYEEKINKKIQKILPSTRCLLTLLNLYNNSCTAVVGPYTYFKSSITDQLAKLKQNIMQKGP